MFCDVANLHIEDDVEFQTYHSLKAVFIWHS
jgi:hypothetical protein